MNNSYFNNQQPKKIWNAGMIVIVCAISVLSIAIIVFSLLLIFSSNKASNSMVAYNQSSSAPVLAITSCPEQVNSDSPYANIEGYIVSDSGSCVLTINGETVTNSGVSGNQVKWSKSIQVQPEETKEVVFELRDNNGVVTSETRYIYCQTLQNVEKKQNQKPKNDAPITAGCSLVKRKAGGLNIREYPGTDYEVVDYIAANDYTSEMVFTGNYRITYDNYTWYEVISPSGKHGYVRSDLVRSTAYTE